jgi:hypothetical protein
LAEIPDDSLFSIPSLVGADIYRGFAVAEIKALKEEVPPFPNVCYS